MSKNFDSPIERDFCGFKPDDFSEWWNTKGKLLMAGNDIHVQRAVMGVAERAFHAGWKAAKCQQ